MNSFQHSSADPAAALRPLEVAIRPCFRGMRAKTPQAAAPEGGYIATRVPYEALL